MEWSLGFCLNKHNAVRLKSTHQMTPYWTIYITQLTPIWTFGQLFYNSWRVASCCSITCLPMKFLHVTLSNLNTYFCCRVLATICAYCHRHRPDCPRGHFRGGKLSVLRGCNDERARVGLSRRVDAYYVLTVDCRGHRIFWELTWRYDFWRRYVSNELLVCKRSCVTRESSTCPLCYPTFCSQTRVQDYKYEVITCAPNLASLL